MFTEQDIILYLNGNMDQKKLQVFRKALKENPKFAEQVEHLKVLRKLAQSHSTEQLKQKLKACEDKLEKEGFFGKNA